MTESVAGEIVDAEFAVNLTPFEQKAAEIEKRIAFHEAELLAVNAQRKAIKEALAEAVADLREHARSLSEPGLPFTEGQ